MIKLGTFKKGGIHPSGNKQLTEGLPLRFLAPGKRVVIPLHQNIGAPSRAIVKKRDEVKVGQLIAEPTSAVSVPVHSSVSGKVKKITSVMTTMGSRVPAVEIIVNEEQEEFDRGEADQSIDLENRQFLLDKIKAAGIVGMGGATFPTHIKLSPPPGVKIDTLILNGAECEPFLTSDHTLLLKNAEDVIRGGQIFMKILGLKQFFIGVEDNKKDAIELLDKLSASYPFAKVFPLKTKYPQGAEKQLIKAITGREVPSGKLPFHAGCVVQNVGTAYAAFEAVFFNKPLIERIITVSGSGIVTPSNIKVRIGTLISDIVEGCGGLNDGVNKIISGGPMMGKTLKSIDIPVVKGTSGLLFFTDKERFEYEEQDCIRCGLCVSVCPQGLVPCDLATYSEYGKLDFLKDIMDCVECGSCAYTCPSKRRLVHWIKLGKSKLRFKATA